MFRFCFGFMLVGLVISRRYWRSRILPAAPDSDIRQHSRRTSRLVYLVLYAVFGAQAIICLFTNRNLLEFANHLQGYLLAGVIALVLIRVLELCGVSIAGQTKAGADDGNSNAELSRLKPLRILIRRVP
jgi:hypothetical protein